MKVGIIGAGSWGLALSIVFSKNNDAKLWVRRREVIDYIEKYGESPDYLKGVKIPSSVTLVSEPQDLSDRDVVFVVVPSKYLRGTLKEFREVLKGKIVISCTKGLEFETLKFPTEIIIDEIDVSDVGVLSGPSHAEEVALGLPCAITLAMDNLNLAKEIQSSISSESFRVYVWDDIRGVEISGVTKNIIAIAAGVCDGLMLGDNAKASLITRGLHEISRFGIKMGGKFETFFGLSGVGDLIVTCTSRHSRNRGLGERIAKGEKPEEVIKSSKMVAEGYYSTPAIKRLAEINNIEMPIVNEVFSLLYEGKSPFESLRSLMSRSLKIEFYQNF
jgi:glycerol-3-phosphate dehydrogenase (NAD(P)+)